MTINEIRITELKEYENNPRKNDNAVDAVAESIKNFGFKVPIIIDKDNIIVAGHTRLKAAEKLGLETVPCIIADDLTEEQVKAFRLADNKVAELAEWDFEKLEQELAGIEDLQMSVFGFDISDFDIENTVEEDEVPEVDDEAEPIVQEGEIWQLGRHRLMCGDSTNAGDVKKLMDGTLADLVVTDPPYNVDYEGKTEEALKIQNDKMSNTEFKDFLFAAFTNMENLLKKGAAFYIWHASREQVNFETALNETGLNVRQQLIWVKNTMVLGRQDYQWKHEPCFYGWKEGAAHYFVDDRTQYTVFEDAININKLTKQEMKDLIKKLLEDKTNTTVIKEDKPARSEEHPTMKPVKLIARQITNSSKKQNNIVDLFAGSGTTLIACEQLERNCYAMEFDPHYCDVIIKRWEKLTGQTAVKIN